MSRKVEIRTRMAELQKEFSALNVEKKEIEASEERAAAREKYKNYLYMIGMNAYKLSEEEKVKEITDEDREGARDGLSGLVYTGVDHHDGSCYVMMKDKVEYNRVQNILTKIEAVENLKDDKVTDKEKWLKVLLGESVE